MVAPQQNCSSAELLASLPEPERKQILATLTEEQAQAINFDWRGFWARKNQVRPAGDWLYWLVLAGRGFGKTRTGAETVREWVNEGAGRIHLVGATASDVRNVMVQGESGLLSVFPPHQRPAYEPSKHIVTFHNGAIAETFTADEPERLRGPQCDHFWADELAAWRFLQEAWENLTLGFRIGDKLQGVISTTPKPLKLLKEIMSDTQTVVTRASSYENRSNLAPSFWNVIRKYEGTRLGRQELEAEILDDNPGALWSRKIIDAYKIKWSEIRWEMLTRVVVAIDPAVTSGEDSDETGIVVCALARSEHVLVLDDVSCRDSPIGWARAAIAAYKKHRADRIVGEVNNGGDLVASNIHTVDPNVPFRAVRASRGKAVRAEPVASLYEQGRVHHVGSFPALEDQMCEYVPGKDQKSPDRMDALVWAITELLIDREEQSVTLFAGRPQFSEY